MKISALLLILYITFYTESALAQEVIFIPVPIRYHVSVDEYMPVEQPKPIATVKEEEPDYYWGN